MVGQDIRVGDPAAGFGAEDACRGQATAAFTGADGEDFFNPVLDPQR